MQILTEYDEQTKQATAIGFRIKTEQGILPFRLPTDVKRVRAILTRQVTLGQAPRSALALGQPERVAWRIIKEWVEAQLALIQIGLVTIDEVMLPYMLTGNKTVYESFKDGNLENLLPAGGQQ